MDPDTIGKIAGWLVLGLGAMWSVISSNRSKRAAQIAEKSAQSVQEKAETIDELKEQLTQLQTRVTLQDQEITLLKSSNALVSNNFEQVRKLLDDVQQERDMLQQKNKQLEETKRELEAQLKITEGNNAALAHQLQAELVENSRLRSEVERLSKALESQLERINVLKTSLGQTDNNTTITNIKQGD